MEQFCVLFNLRRVLCKSPQKHFSKHISYLREAMKMYSKLLRGAKMKTLTTEWLPRLFPGLRVEDRNGVITMKWKAPIYFSDPRGSGGQGRGGWGSGVSNDWCIILGK